MALGAGIIGATAGAICAHRYLEGKKDLNETFRLGARYAAIDLASWRATIAISLAFAKKNVEGQAEVSNFLVFASAVGLVYSYVFFNWATQPLESTLRQNYSIKSKWAIGTTAFLCGNTALFATIYFTNIK